MSETVRIAKISGIVSIVVTLITATASIYISTRGIKAEINTVSKTATTAKNVANNAQNIAKNLAKQEPIKLCPKYPDSSALRHVYDISNLSNRLIFVSVSGYGRADEIGVGSRADLRTEVRLDGQIKAFDIDSRTGINIDNDPLGTSTSFSFVANPTMKTVELSVTESTDKKRTLNAKGSMSCIAVQIPKS
ncbi:MAG: hypothetical protein M3H12_20880 [Chromatiales bacterium]|nr:hypothetical protein [Gammaproteobacteria bacterium]